MTDDPKSRYRPARTQPGNPHQLTLKQHIHSAACIKRFVDDAGRVAVARRGAQQAFSAKPGNDVFCAARVWDHGLEHGLFKSVEDEFQHECDEVIRTGAG